MGKPGHPTGGVPPKVGEVESWIRAHGWSGVLRKFSACSWHLSNDTQSDSCPWLLRVGGTVSEQSSAVKPYEACAREHWGWHPGSALWGNIWVPVERDPVPSGGSGQKRWIEILSLWCKPGPKISQGRRACRHVGPEKSGAWLPSNICVRILCVDPTKSNSLKAASFCPDGFGSLGRRVCGVCESVCVCRWVTFSIWASPSFFRILSLCDFHS